MNIKSRLTAKAVSVILALALTVACVPTGILTISAKASSNELKAGIISDIHYYPDEYCADTAAFEEWSLSGNKQYINKDGILDSALAAFADKAEKEGLKYLLIPGDLSHNGELEAHKALAVKLEAFEAETGIKVIVINGNHDINNHSAASFANGEYAVEVSATTPEEFRDIYKNLGYDIATAVYTPPEGEKAGMLSYAVELDGYRIIAFDAGKYSSDSTESGEDSHETAGNVTPALKEWMLDQIAEANAKGETVIGMDHWSLVPHYYSQATILQGFVIDNYLELSETLADAGMHYVITGHSHSNDVAEHINDNGETMWDIETASVMEFPNFIRTVDFKSDVNGNVTFDYETLDCDCVLPVTDNGTTYERPYRETFSFGYTYKNSATGYAAGFVHPMITNLFKEISEGGGLVKYISKFFDIEAFLKQYVSVITPNLMAFVNDLGSQIDKKYIENPEYTLSLLDNYIAQIANMEVSDYPCLTLYDKYGFGDPDKKGTFGDAVMVVLIEMNSGDEDISDPFMTDVIDQFENGDLGKKVFNKLYDVLVDQFLQDELLSGLYVNVDTFFEDTSYNVAGGYVQLFTDLLVGILGSNVSAESVSAITSGVAQSGLSGKNPADSKGGTTYLQLANAVLNVLDKTDVLKGGSIDGALGVIMEEYLTESQYKAWGHTFADVIADFASDDDPTYKADSNGTLSYNGKVSVPLDDSTYRLPQLISVSLGNDSATTRNISWYSKYTLNTPDIEIIPYSASPVFTGKNSAPSGVNVLRTSEVKNRNFPGIDLGIIGIFDETEYLNRNIAKITGLSPATKYLYRVGDAQKGWWSETGTIETADNSDEVTFLHVSDSQGQNEKQYSVFGNLLETALGMYDDTDLIIHSGDVVDEGSNVKYWQQFFASTESLLSTPLMPVSGNHEAKGDNATVDNFVLPDSVNQDTTSGYYYSFDYNNVHFIMLNTNDTTDDGLGAAQLKWLKSDAKRSTAKWKVVVLHKAIYSNGSHFDDSDVKALRAQFATLMPELGIDVVFQGHDHVYLRTDAMNNNAVVSGDTSTDTFKNTTYTVKDDPDGTVYAISGASGCKSYVVKDASLTDELFPRAEKIVETDLPAFSGIRIVGDMLYFDAYTVDNGNAVKIDSFAIKNSELIGDADLNGKVDIDDAIYILRGAIGINTILPAQFAVCDVDCDNHFTTTDARLVLKKVAGQESY